MVKALFRCTYKKPIIYNKWILFFNKRNSILVKKKKERLLFLYFMQHKNNI